MRTGFMLLWLSILTCTWPNGDRQDVLLNGMSGNHTLEAEVGKAAAAAAEAPAARKGGGSAEAKQPESRSVGVEEYSEAADAIGRMKVKPFEHLDIAQLESVEVTATGYTAGKESTGKSPGHPEYGITYSGVKVRKDDFSTIAADPKVFPIGTIMYVPGYGFGVVADTGGAIKGNKIDLYFDTKQQVYKEWGKRKVRVYILRKGDGKVTEAMMNRLNSFTKAVPVDKKVTDAGSAPARK